MTIFNSLKTATFAVRIIYGEKTLWNHYTVTYSSHLAQNALVLVSLVRPLRLHGTPNMGAIQA